MGAFAIDVCAARAGVWGDQTARVVGAMQMLTHAHTPENHRGAAASPKTCRLKNLFPDRLFESGASLMLPIQRNLPDLHGFYSTGAGTLHQLLQHARRFGCVRRDRIHQRRRQTIVRRKPQRYQTFSYCTHFFRACTGLDN